MVEEREVVVMRISKDLKIRLDKLSEKRKTTLTALTNDAIKRFLNEEEYTFEELLSIVETIPSLRVNKEKIEQEMGGCPAPACKQIIETIKDKQVFLFDETLDSIVKRIEDIEKNDLYGIYIHITSRAKEDINKVNEIFQKITEILKTKKINLGAGMKDNGHEKVLLFISYNKKEEKDDKKK